MHTREVEVLQHATELINAVRRDVHTHFQFQQARENLAAAVAALDMLSRATTPDPRDVEMHAVLAACADQLDTEAQFYQDHDDDGNPVDQPHASELHALADRARAALAKAVQP